MTKKHIFILISFFTIQNYTFSAGQLATPAEIFSYNNLPGVNQTKAAALGMTRKKLKTLAGKETITKDLITQHAAAPGVKHAANEGTVLVAGQTTKGGFDQYVGNETITNDLITQHAAATGVKHPANESTKLIAGTTKKSIFDNYVARETLTTKGIAAHKVANDITTHVAGESSKLTAKTTKGELNALLAQEATLASKKEILQHLQNEGVTHAAVASLKVGVTTKAQLSALAAQEAAIAAGKEGVKGKTLIIAAVALGVGVVAAILGAAKWLHCTAKSAHTHIQDLQNRLYDAKEIREQQIPLAKIYDVH